VALIVTGGEDASATAAKVATTTIPIVFNDGSDLKDRFSAQPCDKRPAPNLSIFRYVKQPEEQRMSHAKSTIALERAMPLIPTVPNFTKASRPCFSEQP
jgi:hypothetical protein